MENKLNFNEQELDMLNEIASIGSGNAATALSQLIKKKINVEMPKTDFIAIEEFPTLFENPDKIVVGTYTEIFGDLSGETMMLFPREDALRLSDLMLGKPFRENETLNEMDESIFKEMTNILTGTYFNALSKMVDMEILPSVPHFTMDILNAIIDFIIIKLSSKVNTVLYMKANIEIEGQDIRGTMLILFDTASLKKIVDALIKKIR